VKEYYYQLVAVLLMTILLVTSGCINKRSKMMRALPTDSLVDTTGTIQEEIKPPIIVNVWIHGTRLAPKGILENFFYSPDGLMHSQLIDTKYHVRTIVDTICQGDPEQFDSEHFYIFGWCGSLCFNARHTAGQKLYQALIDVQEMYWQRDRQPVEFRLFAHSHGGNVALSAAHWHPEDAPSFTVRELVLMACPVQEHTQKYLLHPSFQTVYSLYSTIDLIQIIDPQGLYKNIQKPMSLFSQRVFKHDPKIYQVRLRMDRHPLTHGEFIFKPFLRHMGAVLNAIREHALLYQPDKHPLIHITTGSRRPHLHRKFGTPKVEISQS
jgi:hypothetical protein